jgi:hypothetical protein
MTDPDPSSPPDETTEERAATVADEIVEWLPPRYVTADSRTELQVEAVDEFVPWIDSNQESSGYKAVILFAVGHFVNGERLFPLPVLGADSLAAVVYEALQVDRWTRQHRDGQEWLVRGIRDVRI